MTLSPKVLAMCGRSTFGGRPRSIASTRGGVSGSSSGRLPVASAIAEATVAATLRIGNLAGALRAERPARRCALVDVHLHRDDVERQRNPMILQPRLADTALRVERRLISSCRA